MKNFFIIITLLILSCNDKNASTEIATTGMAMADITAVMENVNSEPPLEGAIVNNGFRTASQENHTTSENSDFNSNSLYEGTLNDNTKIRVYVNEQEQPCGNSSMLTAMYKYDNQDKWILLSVSIDSEEKNYCMVEDNFTGVLFLEENENHLSGYWVSPNAQKQLKVELTKEILDEATIEKLDEILFDDLIFNKNDC